MRPRFGCAAGVKSVACVWWWGLYVIEAIVFGAGIPRAMSVIAMLEQSRKVPKVNTTRRELIDDLIYARVLVTLQVQQHRRAERDLRDRLRELLLRSELTPCEQKRVCDEALARAWKRAANSLLATDELTGTCENAA